MAASYYARRLRRFLPTIIFAVRCEVAAAPLDTAGRFFDAPY
jgi:hypothetical protein